MVLSMARWVGKTAIITGASSGIGAAIADALVEKGLNVLGVSPITEPIDKRAKELSDKPGKLCSFYADVTCEDQVLSAFKWGEDNFGPVHILVNSAGVFTEELLSEGKLQTWKTSFEVNVLGLCLATREAVKMMRKHDVSGHIVHINSIAGHHVGFTPKMNVYPATKFAITALTETLRQELTLLGTRIRVTSVSPGLVFSEFSVLNKNVSEEKREALKKRPFIKPEDIADGVVYALSTPEHVQVHELTIKPVGERY